MSRHLSIRELEEAREGAPAPAHVIGCAECARKLAFVRAERALLRRAAARNGGRAEDLWAGAQARIARGRRRRSRLAWAASLATAAVMTALVVVSARISDRTVAPGAKAVLDHAETQYLQAILAIESSVESRERRLPPEDVLQRRAARARAREVIAQAPLSGPSMRVRRLEGYAAYLRSLRHELDEAP